MIGKVFGEFLNYLEKFLGIWILCCKIFSLIKIVISGTLMSVTLGFNICKCP